MKGPPQRTKPHTGSWGLVLLASLIAITLSAGEAVTLKDAFQGQFLMGAALNPRQFMGKDAPGAALVKAQFNSITPENVLKWAVVHPGPERYHFGPADQYVAFGERNGMVIIGHTLVWHQQTPRWVFRGVGGEWADRQTLLERMRAHIHAVVGRYRGRIHGWDVVNEALNDDGTLRQSAWLRIMGEDYIAKAFEFAHEADPKAELYYNDYGLENEPKRRGALNLIAKLKARGVPISGIGLQNHDTLDWPTAAQLGATIDAFAGLGLKVMITELDVDVLPQAAPSGNAELSLRTGSKHGLNPYRNGLPDSVQQTLAERYAELFKVFEQHRQQLARVTFWGVSDGDSWLNNRPVRGRTNYPLLFDRQHHPKPAFYAVIRTAGRASPRDQHQTSSVDTSTNAPAPLNWTSEQDHKNMMEQLGIAKLRPGPSGWPGATNSANYDPAKANPFPNLPRLLTLKDGQKVTTAAMWWKQRRPQIVEDFEREVLGRVPTNVPKVTWREVSKVTDGLVSSLAANGRRVVGHVDNSACPSITVDIRMTVVTPAHAKGPVPVLMMFGGFGGDGMPRPAGTPAPTNRFREFGGPFKDPPSTEQLLAAGWGYATLIPNSVQADNGAGLTKGIIGLVNHGRPRKPDDWGALRAWAWGAARGLDYLETDPAVDARKVGIEGVSRFGKAALVAMAFEPRFAMALVGSSGEGGAKLYRRNFGEAVENLTGTGEYHWMAGNFLKYGAAEAVFGSKNAGDLPVDAHMLIALCAPRLVFISYGVPARGDANWLDQQGSFMAAVAAGPVYRLLGARDLGVKQDYRAARMPPVNTGLLDGQLAWRQHDGGHEDRSNMRYFIAWANKLFHEKADGPSP